MWIDLGAHPTVRYDPAVDVTGWPMVIERARVAGLSDRGDRSVPIRVRVALAGLVVLMAACTTVRPLAPGMRVEVLTPVDGVPVRDLRVWSAAESASGEARDAILLRLRGALADSLTGRGVEVCEDQLEMSGSSPDVLALARRARADGVDAIVLPELLAYGQVRRSWLWVLLAQGLVAGVGHGVVAAEVTGKPRDGWLVGGGEFLVETVTWVGGALVASRVIDPVIVRLWVVRASDGRSVRKVGEGLRPLRDWLHRGTPRPARVEAVGRRVLSRLGGKLVTTPAQGRVADSTARSGPATAR